MVTKIDYADNGIEHFESRLPRTMQFVALNTNVPHVLAESDYAHRVQVIALDDHGMCTASRGLLLMTADGRCSVQELTLGVQFLSSMHVLTTAPHSFPHRSSPLESSSSPACSRPTRAART